MANNTAPPAIKPHRYLTPVLVIGGTLLYSIIGWLVTENVFIMPQDWLLKIFGAICLIVNLYVVSKIFEDGDKWTEHFWFFFIAFALIFSSMTLENRFQEYAFIALTLLFGLYAFLMAEKFSIEGILKFLSIIITYLGLVSIFYTFGKPCLENWMSMINSIVDIRLVISSLILLIVIGEGFIKAIRANKPKIRKIPYILFTPSLTDDPFIGIVDGFKKSGVWIRNNAVIFINIVWTFIAYVAYYFWETIKNAYNRVKSFFKNSDTVISASLTILGCLLFTDFTIRLSKYELQYLLTSDFSVLLSLTCHFLLTILLSVFIKIALNFRYSNLNLKYIKAFFKNTFSGMIQAPITVAAYYCASGWVLMTASFVLWKIYNKDFLPHFHELGIYTIIASVIIIIVGIVVSIFSPKSLAATEFNALDENPINWGDFKKNAILIFLILVVLFVSYYTFFYPSDSHNKKERRIQNKATTTPHVLPPTSKPEGQAAPSKIKTDTISSVKAKESPKLVPPSNNPNKPSLDTKALTRILMDARASAKAGDFNDAIVILDKTNNINNLPSKIKSEIKVARAYLKAKEKNDAISAISKIFKSINNF